MVRVAEDADCYESDEEAGLERYASRCGFRTQTHTVESTGKYSVPLKRRGTRHWIPYRYLTKVNAPEPEKKDKGRDKQPECPECEKWQDLPVTLLRSAKFAPSVAELLSQNRCPDCGRRLEGE